MIRSFRHKGLQRFYERGTKSGIQPKHVNRLRMQLAALDSAFTIEDMGIPGYKLHQLRGRTKNRWAIWVNGNWHLTFEFSNGDVHILDYEDYH